MIQLILKFKKKLYGKNFLEKRLYSNTLSEVYEHIKTHELPTYDLFLSSDTIIFLNIGIYRIIFYYQ